ncbi:ribonuclease E activity regulator RraA [Niveispirillum fermenti]|uniref:ribonuclease E activity regulator RraA n=1 Tax=Niveispirillum fermenti TaxID=1233113 RepID=UPI003A86717C
MDFATADLVDTHEAVITSCWVQMRNYGGQVRFAGPIRTVRCHRDNALLKSILSKPGDGAVLVVDGGGSLASALVGDIIAGLAVKNGWAGIIVNGVIRDSAAIGELPLGVKALGTNPLKSAKTGSGEADQTVSFGDCAFTPGHWVYSDEDGVVVLPEKA